MQQQEIVPSICCNDDMCSATAKHVSNKAMSVPELQVDNNDLLHAGMETTPASLTGSGFFLLQDPRELTTRVDEVRPTFQSDMISASVHVLDYLDAVSEGGQHLVPPVPERLVRPPDGKYIAGHWVPGDICHLPFSRPPLTLRLPAATDLPYTILTTKPPSHASFSSLRHQDIS